MIMLFMIGSMALAGSPEEPVKEAVTASTIAKLQKRFEQLPTEIQKAEMAAEEQVKLLDAPIHGKLRVLRADISRNKSETELGAYKVFGYLLSGQAQVCVVCVFTSSAKAKLVKKDTVYTLQSGRIEKVAGAFHKNMTMNITEE